MIESNMLEMFDASALPVELLQVLGSHLSPAELRAARLVCKPWATALAVCMPAMTMCLPHQAAANVFRQPLMLCSSGQLNSAQSLNYSAAPVPRAPALASMSGPAGSFVAPAPAIAGHSSGAAGTAPVPRRGGSSSNNSGQASRPSPFATKGGQAVANNNISGIAPGALPPSPFLGAVASLPPGTFPRMEPSPWTSAAAAAAAACCSSIATAVHAQPPLPPQDQGVIQGWSSLPAAGLRTCSSLQQLHLQLSGAPPTPQDLEDLSKLPNLTHLSFRQVEGPAACPAVPRHTAAQASSRLAAAEPERGFAVAAGDVLMWDSAGSCTKCSGGISNALDQAAGASTLVPAAPAFERFRKLTTSSSEDSSYVSAAIRSRSTSCSSLDDLVGAADSISLLSIMQSPDHNAWGSAVDGGETDSSDYGSSVSGDAVVDVVSPRTCSDQAASPAAMLGFRLTGSLSQRTECVSCSVITLQHVAALAKLPHLSSLELHPKQGSWDEAATAALAQLTLLTGLTKLSLTWGDAACTMNPVADAEAVQLAHGVQLPLQQCLYGLGPQLQELGLKGCAVVDVVVLQRMQRLRKLQAEALTIVNSDAVQRLQEAQPAAVAAAQAGAAIPAHHQQQQQQGDADAQPAAVPDQQQRRSLKWATLPLLESLRVVHPASDISILLQGTQTPALSELGFVTRGPSDFARILGQHGKLKVLHLVFPEDEPWHPIAVVRLPTALPSLRSLTLEGKFWLPNSLIVALGVMEVPIEELNLTCKLAPPCLERLQHLKQLKKLVLHHVAWTGHPADGLVTKDVMLQLPAKLLPPGLRDLEISNGWILH